MSPVVDRAGPQGSERDREAVPESLESPPRRRRRRRVDESAVVPEAEFTSYYGRPIVKESPWEADIPAYLFSGGLAAGSSLLAAGADLSGRAALRRTGRLGAMGALLFSMAALVHDLGRPMRFVNMLRVAKLTSPMSVGTWILTLYSPFASAAFAAEAVDMLPARMRRGPLRLVSAVGRPMGVIAALTAPPVAAYTAVLLADTALPTWHDGYRELPFVFVGSAAAAAGGLGMLASPSSESGPARKFAAGGALLELAFEHRMESSVGLAKETMHSGTAGRLIRASKMLTVAGAVGSLLGGRSRRVASASGVALMLGSICTRFGIFEAGQASARDPKYTVIPQRERLNRGQPVRYHG